MNPLVVALTLAGLLFELFSLSYQGRKVIPLFFKSYEEKKAKHFDEAGLGVKHDILEREKSWFITLLLLVIGLTFQAVAIIIS